MKKLSKISALLLTLLLALSICLGSCDLAETEGNGDDLSNDNAVTVPNKTEAPAKTEAKEPDETVETEDSSKKEDDETESDRPESGETEGSETESKETLTGTDETEPKDEAQEQTPAEIALGVPKYSGSPFAILNNNNPKFTADEITTECYEFYSELDALGRCGYAMSCVGKDTMPPKEADRGSISSVKPSGWVNHKYDTALVDGGYIYNRSHIIGWQLTWEDANKKNLITGTRYMNVEGMLPFENMVADYIKEENGHVMYRVTPVYNENDLVACGVIMEGYSVEDEGESICFNVYIYNVQPGIVIDYTTGNNWLASELPEQSETSGSTESSETADASKTTYVLNTSTKKVHKPTCSSAINTKEENKREYVGTLSELTTDGYTACGICKPQ